MKSYLIQLLTQVQKNIFFIAAVATAWLGDSSMFAFLMVCAFYFKLDDICDAVEGPRVVVHVVRAEDAPQPEIQQGEAK